MDNSFSCSNDHRISGILDSEAEVTGDQPIINVSWQDAKCFTDWLYKTTGQKYRLPSEAEWEYAARAEGTGEFFWGNETQLAERYAWFFENAEGTVHTIGNKLPNKWGLYDTAGNVWEWVEDCYTEDPNLDTFESTKLVGSCERRVIRGGGWNNDQVWLRSTSRYWVNPKEAGSNLGFRLAKDIE